jgi:hypothetical protein
VVFAVRHVRRIAEGPAVGKADSSAPLRNDKQKRAKCKSEDNCNGRSRFLPRSTTLRVRNGKQKGDYSAEF